MRIRNQDAAAARGSSRFSHARRGKTRALLCSTHHQPSNDFLNSSSFSSKNAKTKRVCTKHYRKYRCLATTDYKVVELALNFERHAIQILSPVFTGVVVFNSIAKIVGLVPEIFSVLFSMLQRATYINFGCVTIFIKPMENMHISSKFLEISCRQVGLISNHKNLQDIGIIDFDFI
jgi:hypothetical protein